MEKRETKVVSITASCGAAGCKFKEYTMPYAGTQEDFKRHFTEKFKVYPKKAA